MSARDLGEMSKRALSEAFRRTYTGIPTDQKTLQKIIDAVKAFNDPLPADDEGKGWFRIYPELVPKGKYLMVRHGGPSDAKKFEREILNKLFARKWKGEDGG